MEIDAGALYLLAGPSIPQGVRERAIKYRTVRNLNIDADAEAFSSYETVSQLVSHCETLPIDAGDLYLLAGKNMIRSPHSKGRGPVSKYDTVTDLTIDAGT